MKQKTLPPKRYFTIAEVNALLPRIEEHFYALLKVRDALQLLGSIELDFPDPFHSFAKDIRYTKEYHKLSLDFYSHLDALATMGCFIKDIEQGLVDFYAKHEGQEVFLCWKLGESSVSHWHHVHAGFAGRRKI